MAHPYVELLRLRDVRIVWAGHALSSLGSELYRVGVLWLAVELAGANGSLLVTAQTATILVMSLAAGAVVDLLPRPEILIVADLLAAAATLAVVILAAGSGLTLGVLIAATVAVAAIGAAAYPLFQASLPRLAPPERLREVSGLFDATGRASGAVGPFLAAGVLALLPAVHLLTLNAVSFLATALAVAMVGRAFDRQADERAPVQTGVLRRLARGFTAVRKIPGGLGVLGVSTLRAGAMALGFNIAVPLLFSQEEGSGGLGAVAVLFGAVAVADAITGLVVVTSRPKRPLRRLFEGHLVSGVGLMLMAAAAALLGGPERMAAMIAGCLLLGVGGTVSFVQLLGWFGERLETDDFAAVLRLRLATTIAGMMAASAAGPFLLPLVGPSGAMALCGAATIVAGGIGTLSRQAQTEEVSQKSV